MKNLKLKELTKQELKEINGGDFGITLAAIGLAMLGMAIYENGKHFVVGMFSPFTSNE
jgi:bacteriocin-like protein